MKKNLFVILISTSFLWLHEQSSAQELPFGRILDPAGKQIFFGDSSLENHAMDCALSPEGKWLAVEERYGIVFINTKKNKIAYTLPFSHRKEIENAMSTYSGIIWHSNMGEEYVLSSCADRRGNSYVVKVSWNGAEAKIDKIFYFLAKKPAVVAIPNELLIRKESGKDYLYVVLNGNNQLVKQDLESGELIWTVNTGVAPYGISSAKNKIYVTNWGGRIPLESDKDVAGVPWGLMRIDPSNAASREGSISVFDPLDGHLIKEIVVGLHPNEIISSPDGHYIYITNSNSDKVSVIQTASDEISESISLRMNEEYNTYFGDSPNGIGLSGDGSILFVANGMDNAVAVIQLGNNASVKGSSDKSDIMGFIPTGAYPSSVVISTKGKLYITNLEASSSTLPVMIMGRNTPIYNAHVKLASISVVKMPNKSRLRSYTKTVYAVNQLARLKTAELPPRENVNPKPVPDRIGEPSVFKHVLYIIRENRTYDQVLGDMPEGKGDSSLCIYGREVTPNAHKLAREFQLLDNFMVSGKCSAEGHQWTDASIVTDYIEKNVRAWFRSYPHVQTDALVYAPSGFLWDNAKRSGKEVIIYGEAAVPVFKNSSITWTDIYSGYLKGETLEFTNKTTLNTVEDILSPTFPSYDGHKIPDVYRASTFIADLNRYESMEGDSLPALMIMALPNDHTGGTRPGLPTPRAMMADNDLALGKIVEAVSRSRFWKNTIIFVVEDDSQAGWDHVSAYRTVGIVISPYSRLESTIHTPYNQPSMIRTMEQILGMPPMNIQDAIADPMVECFNETPDFTPYKAVPNQIPLDEMNPPLSAITGEALYYALKSLEPQFDGIDRGDDDLFNRILWFAAKGDKPYPQIYAGEDDDED